MKRKFQFILLFALLIPFSKLIAQDKIATVDSILSTIYKENHKCKRIIIGTLRSGAAYWFLRKNGKIFGIEVREEFKTGKRYDSAIMHHYYYQEDTLVKAICEKHSHINGKSNWGVKHLYFEKNKVTSQLSYKDAPEVEIDELIKEAYVELQKGYVYRKNK